MKRLLTITIISFFTIQMSAQSSEVKRMIKKYDASYLRNTSFRYDPTSFWNSIIQNDKNVIAYNKAVKKNNKTLNQAYGALLYSKNQQNGYEYTTTSYNDVVSRLVNDLGIQSLVYNKPVKVIKDGSINASMDFEGQLRINEGCFTRLLYDEVLAVCAHEIAHYVCQHVIMSVWKVAKKQKTNRMWAEIGYSFTVGAMAATSMYAGSNGVDNSTFNNIITNSDILNYAYSYADGATTRYHYRYNRNEEAEADIIAYRFMEQTGHGGVNVLSLLRKLLSMYGDTPTGVYDNHPSTLTRISVIEAMIDGYSGK